jgi:hypothetical protein
MGLTCVIDMCASVAYKGFSKIAMALGNYPFLIIFDGSLVINIKFIVQYSIIYNVI